MNYAKKEALKTIMTNCVVSENKVVNMSEGEYFGKILNNFMV